MTEHMSAAQYREGTANPKGKTVYALGRLADGEMNKTETAYADYLETLKGLGDVLWYDFESIRFKLAKNTMYIPDFSVLPASGVFEFYDVKGAKAIVEDDSWAKMKIAAGMFPFRFFLAFPVKGNKGAWKIEEVSA
jgi:hypothetical protein